MSKLKKFNLKDWKSGKYTVRAFDGGTVEIVAIDENRDAIFGFYEDVSTTWKLDGSRITNVITDHRDLYLSPKAITLHINITRSKAGVLGACTNTERQPKLNRGTTLVKYITVDVEG
jgi:hypothetical protein